MKRWNFTPPGRGRPARSACDKGLYRKRRGGAPPTSVPVTRVGRGCVIDGCHDQQRKRAERLLLAHEGRRFRGAARHARCGRAPGAPGRAELTPAPPRRSRRRRDRSALSRVVQRESQISDAAGYRSPWGSRRRSRANGPPVRRPPPRIHEPRGLSGATD